MNIEQAKLRVWKIAGGVGGVLIAFLAVLIVKELASVGHLGDKAPVNTISVTGTGNAYAIPDIATFSFTVTENSSTVSAGQTAASALASSSIAAILAEGVAADDIKTTSYTITPHYEYSGGVCTNLYCPPSSGKLTGYDVSQTIQVKVRDISKAGEIFSSIGSLGVQNVDGLDFSVDNPDTVQGQARSSAIADAQSKAQELAKELGVSLGPITDFSESNGNYPTPVYAMASAAGSNASAAPQVPAGQEEITDNVTITYQIK